MSSTYFFVNMDFDGVQWWIDYYDNEYLRNYYNTKEEAYQFYYTFHPITE